MTDTRLCCGLCHARAGRSTIVEHGEIDISMDEEVEDEVVEEPKAKKKGCAIL